MPSALAVSDANTKNEIKAALDEAGIAYSSSDTKAQLLDKAGVSNG